MAIKLINKNLPEKNIPLSAVYHAKQDSVVITQFFFNLVLPFPALEKIYETAKLDRAKAGLLKTNKPTNGGL